MTIPLSQHQAPAESWPDRENPSSPAQPGTIAHLGTHVAAAPLTAEQVLCLGCGKPVNPIQACPYCAADNRSKGFACCTPIDVPGVGREHAPGCPNRAPVNLRAPRAYTPGEVPESLRMMVGGETLAAGPCGRPKRCAERRWQEEAESELDAARDRLLGQLVFAAKDLAESQIVEARDGEEPAVCAECVEAERDGHIGHAPDCRTARVLGVLRDLTATLPEFNPNRKEAAPDGETGRAGEGIRPRGIPLMDAAKALRNAALEEMVELPGRLTSRCNVCGSSVTGLDKTERDIVHGCDCWVGNALVVLESDDLEGGAR